jgi:maltooligosyltrehalose trehalohydrolase
LAEYRCNSGGKTLNDAVDGRRSVGAVRQPNGDTDFIVWAPTASSIALKLVDDSRPLVPMQPSGNGYYHATVANLSPAARYFYRLNDAVDRPDPASRFQPEGVHGPSAVADSHFTWTDQQWHGRVWEEFVIYESHVGTFSSVGTFEAMIEHLDELVSLGVTAIQLMPVAQFPGGRNWGYDGVHPYAPQNTYGGPRGLKSLVDACHARSLAVVLDVVYNHVGPEGNYLAEFGPYFTDRHRTGWGPAINFDGPGSDAVRDFFVGNATYWLDEFHIDALRLDATHAIFDESARPLLGELADAVRECGRRLNRSVYTIAEHHSNDPRIVRLPQLGGYGLDALLLDDFQHALQALLTGEQSAYYGDFGRLSDFSKAYQSGFVLTGQHSKYRGCRWGGASAEIPADRFVAFAGNHDTVGNRPRAERLGRLVDFNELKLAAAATILSPAIPFLFMGEEYDDPAPFYFFTSHIDPGLAAAVRTGREREFAEYGWPATGVDPQSPETFAASRLTRSLAASGRHAVLWRFYRELLRLRREMPAIRQPAREHSRVTVLEGERVLLAQRQGGGEAVFICWNFGDAPQDLSPHLPSEVAWQVLLDSSELRWCDVDDAAKSAPPRPAPLVVVPKSCLLLAGQLPT